MSEYDLPPWKDWKAWVECPECEQNDEIVISIRSRSVGIWCDRCEINAFYE